MKTLLKVCLLLCVCEGGITSAYSSAPSFLDKNEEEPFKAALTAFKNLRTTHPQIKSLAKNKPSCFISYAQGLDGEAVDTLAPHLEIAGINRLQDIEKADFVVVCGSKELINAYNNPDIITPTKIQLNKINQQKQNILLVWLEGSDKTEVLPEFLWNESAIDFRKKEDYCYNCFSLLKQLYKLQHGDSFVERIINDFHIRKAAPVKPIDEKTLIQALDKGDVATVQAYLKAGGEVDKIDHKGRTLLERACYAGQLKLCQFLLTQSAKPNHQDNLGNTPLYMASNAGHIDIIKDLLKYMDGANDPLKLKTFINTADNRGVTALHIAIKNGHSEVVTLLCEKGANVNAPTQDKQTPLSLAQRYNHDAIRACLKKYGAREN